jgi:hypothetical protein
MTLVNTFFVEGKNPIKDMRDHVKTCASCQYFLKAGDWKTKEELEQWIAGFYKFSRDEQEEMLAVMAGFYRDMQEMFRAA